MSTRKAPFLLFHSVYATFHMSIYLTFYDEVYQFNQLCPKDSGHEVMSVLGILTCEVFTTLRIACGM